MASKARTPAGLLETAEGRRLEAARLDPAWRRWGPYLSERQWGTVREDYSPDGDAWDYFPHDHARIARLPLGRGRHRRLLRRPTSAGAWRSPSGTGATRS